MQCINMLININQAINEVLPRIMLQDANAINRAGVSHEVAVMEKQLQLTYGLSGITCFCVALGNMTRTNIYNSILANDMNFYLYIYFCKMGEGLSAQTYEMPYSFQGCFGKS